MPATNGAFQTSASVQDADEKIPSVMKDVELECGDISSTQEKLLPFIGSGGAVEEEPDVFSTPPEQNSQGQGEEEEDVITMCTLPFTSLSPSPSPSSPEGNGEDEDQDDSTATSKEPLKPRICMRKVRGLKIRTPSPNPTPSPSPNPIPNPSPSADHVVRDEEDPLYKALLMIPSAPAPTFSGDILALARERGIF